MIHADELLKLMPYARGRIAAFIDPLNTAMNAFDINTPLREAAFLAQVAHESGELRYVRELASGAAYEGRADLGNTEPGDGERFPGRGLLQVTGRANYLACGNALGLDLIASPELLELPEHACSSAGWFWRDYKHLNALADQENFLLITRKINGGANGYDKRLAYYEHAKLILGA